jgi:hypothetical protein
VLMTWEEDALPGFGVDPKQLALTRENLDKRRSGRRKEAVTEQRRAVVPLAEMDDWLDFAESLLGRGDVPADSLISEFERLDELEPYEDALPDLMGMDLAVHLEERYPWVATARDIAEQHGFFHWELEFAQVFTRGGYDLQVGNPPWVRPTWQEGGVLAEFEPWFMLSEKPSTTEWRLRKAELLASGKAATYFLDELAANLGTVSILGSAATYPTLGGTQPDLYRAFMCRSWANLSVQGTVGLIHPDSHFGGAREGKLREAAYQHLRFHAHYWNQRHIFADIKETRQFSTNIYGRPSPIDFPHISWLFAPQTLMESLTHAGKGVLPGLKHESQWDLRPHAKRLVRVDSEQLASWNRLTRESTLPDSQAALLYPVTSAEQEAITTLSNFNERMGSYNPYIGAGYHETAAKKDGYIRWDSSSPNTLGDVILQGPHFGIATPFEKQPNSPLRNRNDYVELDLTTLAHEVVPRTNYVRNCDEPTYIAAQDRWNGRRYTEFFRLAWRRMIPFDTERSLFAALIPPGPTHVNTIQSMALRDNRLTALNAGFWAALPLDYLLRITGRADLTPAGVKSMPAPTPNHPLATPLLLRTLRLNALTTTYAPLWAELFHPTWPGYEDWAYQDWPNLKPLSAHLTPNWDYRTPLRTEYERRAALVELDALVSVWLGITADQLTAIFKSRYYILDQRESEMYFDANGRKIAASHHTYGHDQTKETYAALLAYLEDPDHIPPPAGYQAPFYKANREAEMRAAHAHFQARLDAEIAAGRWSPASA